jgi:hypothetical protein
LMGGSSWQGVCRTWISSSSSSPSSSGVLFKGWGWKTCSKCLAKAWAFSSLLLAQVPCGVLSDGEDLVICLVFLVTFHRQ